jgi:2-polyprenyl-3-methyl-5-hydroxy-6-metoxy-1,4-benzoquinol methylase
MMTVAVKLTMLLTMTSTPEDCTRDPVNQSLIDLRDRIGFARLGVMNNKVWHEDPRRLVFTLARYKFVSKMLRGKERAVEVGCGDAFGSRIVRQEVRDLLVVDYDPLFITDAQARMTPPWEYEARVHDILTGPVPGIFDAAYSLDVLEHIPENEEDRFITNITASLQPYGVLIVGMPSLESQTYASPESKAGHINCKSGDSLKSIMEKYFHNVFVFSMNDEVVHTGFHQMAHYLLAVCCSRKEIGGVNS